MKINVKWLPIKAHYFFLHAVIGPVDPQISVYGKELGISSAVMGTVMSVLPLFYLVAKLGTGILVDLHRNYRKCIFLALIILTALFYSIVYIISIWQLGSANLTFNSLTICNDTELPDFTRKYRCRFDCGEETAFFFLMNHCKSNKICALTDPSGKNCLCKISPNNLTLNFVCNKSTEDDEIYESATFWSFVVAIIVATTGLSVVTCINDALCLDLIGRDGDFGKQKMWSSIGYGTAALISGSTISISKNKNKMNYLPTIIMMVTCFVMDMIVCVKLELPVMDPPVNIFKDFKEILKRPNILIFLVFAVLLGVFNTLLNFFLFWYVEELAVETHTENIKFIEGLIVAARTFGGEIIFFSISGQILERLGHVTCFSLCFFSYSLRLWLIWLVPSPWWIIFIEFVFSGPCYALSYSTIVVYANELAPPGASATMQGITPNVDDGLGFALGSVLIGQLFADIGTQTTLQVFSISGIVCGVAYVFLYRCILHQQFDPNKQSYQQI